MCREITGKDGNQLVNWSERDSNKRVFKSVSEWNVDEQH